MSIIKVDYGNVSGGGKVYKLESYTLPSSSATHTVDATSVPSYSSLTADDFFLKLTTAKTRASGSSSYDNTPTLSYNSSTGQLTITSSAMVGATTIVCDVLCCVGCTYEDLSS